MCSLASLGDRWRGLGTERGRHLYYALNIGQRVLILIRMTSDLDSKTSFRQLLEMWPLYRELKGIEYYGAWPPSISRICDSCDKETTWNPENNSDAYNPYRFCIFRCAD